MVEQLIQLLTAHLLRHPPYPGPHSACLPATLALNQILAGVMGQAAPMTLKFGTLLGVVRVSAGPAPILNTTTAVLGDPF